MRTIRVRQMPLTSRYHTLLLERDNEARHLQRLLDDAFDDRELAEAHAESIAQERDALRAELDRTLDAREQAEARAESAERERDALRAELEQTQGDVTPLDGRCSRRWSMLTLPSAPRSDHRSLMAPVAQDLVGPDACSRDGEKIGQIQDTIAFTSSYLDNAPKIDTWKGLPSRDKDHLDSFIMRKAA